VRVAQVLESILIGSGFAIAAAFQPGPLQAFLFSSVTRQGWKKTLPAALAPVLSDGPIALITLVILNQLSEGMTLVLRMGGGILLLYFAWSSYKQWRSVPDLEDREDASVPKTMLQAALVNLLNPNPYLGWGLILGPAAINAWDVAPVRAVVLVAAFYITIVFATMGVVLLFGLTTFLSERNRRSLVLLSAIILALLGGYQLYVVLSKTLTAM
jgi:threonine/homoserine/homoserine lactone efflux protein